MTFSLISLQTSSRIMKASQCEGSFQLSSSLVLECPVTKEYGVFSKGILPSSFGMQLRTVAISSIVLGVSGVSLTKTVGSIPNLALGF